MFELMICVIAQLSAFILMADNEVMVTKKNNEEVKV
jgi:hypothetical protein